MGSNAGSLLGSLLNGRFTKKCEAGTDASDGNGDVDGSVLVGCKSS